MLRKLATAIIVAITLAGADALAADADVDAPASDAATDGSTMSRICSADGTSSVAQDGTVTACAPFRCAEGACATACASTADCAAGFACGEVGACVSVVQACSADGLTSISRDTGRSCVPYRCRTDGACATSCATNDDCSGGTICEGRDCTNAKVPPEDDGGCAFGARSSVTGGAFAIALAALARAARRRR